MTPTHHVFNQSHPVDGLNLLEIDRPLQDIFKKENISVEGSLQEAGKLAGSAEWIKKGELANRYPPVLHTHDHKGHRIDEVEFHPAYHEFMELNKRYQTHSLPWVDTSKGSHIRRMALYYLITQNEGGTGCPITMTFSCVAPLQKYFPKAADWLPLILNNQYDPSNRPWFEKKGLTIGMAMTEKQGGTDVRANTSFATPAGAATGAGERYELTGHKWFCSAPMCDAFLTLAQTPKGLSCFLLPRWREDSTRNAFYIQRLKNKLGNRSNASSEVEFTKAEARMVGEEGRGVRTIIEMVALTRYDCMLGSSTIMRRGLTEVLQHIKGRKVMGKLLVHQPLMRNVVADLCLESEAALALTYRTAQCLENQQHRHEQLLLRLLTPVGKYWITKRAIHFAAEAMECLGGNGYVEDMILARLYREAPVNAIWEGSGNVQCLDILRAISREEEVLTAYLTELETAVGYHPLYDRFLTGLKNDLHRADFAQGKLRRWAMKLALAIQACTLIHLKNEAMVEGFCQSRLNDQTGWLMGCELEEKWVDGILDRYLF